MINEYPKTADTITETVVGGRSYMRIAVACPPYLGDESPEKFAATYTEGRLRPDDILIFSAQAIAIRQGRYYNLANCEPTEIAKKCAKMLTKSEKAVMFADVRVMQAAINELGAARVRLAAGCEEIMKNGIFYSICGSDSLYMDTAVCGGYTLLTLKPEDEITVAEKIAFETGCRTVIADVRRQPQITAMTDESLPADHLADILKDAPMRVGSRKVPICIIREK